MFSNSEDKWLGYVNERAIPSSLFSLESRRLRDWREVWRLVTLAHQTEAGETYATGDVESLIEVR